MFQCHIFLLFYTVHGVLKVRLLKWFAIPFSSGPHFARTLHHDLSILVALHGMDHSFTELDKAVVHVISLISFLGLWYSLCLPSDALSQHLPSWVSLTLEMGYLFTAAPAKRSRCSLTWTRGIFSLPPLLTLYVD